MPRRVVLALLLTVAPTLAFAEDAPTPASGTPPSSAVPAPAVAPAQNSIQLVWTVFLGGINLGTVGIKTSFTGDSYSAVSRLKTAGVLNSFYASVIDASSVGTVMGDAVHPL